MSAISSVARRLPLVGSKGFEFRETMSGHHVLLDGPRAGEKLSFSFRARAFTDSLADFADPGNSDRMSVRLTGELQAEGLAEKTPLEGTLEFHPLARKGMLVYAFDFSGDDGQRYHFRGHKDRQGLKAVKSMTTLYGQVTKKQTGEKVSQGITYFDMKDLRPFLASYKLI